MKTKLAALLLWIPLATGCVTAKHWSAHRERDMMHGAAAPDLRLFLTPDRRDVLVTYRETRGGGGAEVPRAYYVRANAARVSANRKPEFVSPDLAAALRPIPIDPSARNFTKAVAPAGPGLRARLSSTDLGFTLTHEGKDLEQHPLPRYESSSAILRKAAWTPLTVAGDGLLLAVMLAGAGAMGGGR